jgi:NAD(P)-dependent dehydrogenase (short-subunit alcohol dehydrogenase family)
MQVRNKTIIVTGGGSGLGRALVLDLLERGAKVLAVDINDSALAETKRLAGSKAGSLFTSILDISDREKVAAFAEHAIQQFGQICGLINNAGIIQPFKRINDLDYQVIDKVFDVDFFGTLYMTKAFLPHFLTLPEAHIVNVSSMGGLFPVPGQSIYGAAKAGVKLLTEGLQTELKNTNVKVTLICPGGIETDIKFNSGAGKSEKSKSEVQNAVIKPVKPAKAALIIVDSMEKNKQKVLIGKDIKALNFVHKISPGFARNLINKQMKSHLPE